MKLLKRFGDGDQGVEMGYDLPFLIGWLESLVGTEADNIKSFSSKSPKAKRLALVEEALSKLNQALEMGNEEN